MAVGLATGCQAQVVMDPEVGAEEGADEAPDDPVPDVPTSGPVTTGPVDPSTGGADESGGSGEAGGSGSASTTVPPGSCGDGVVDEGEGCDLGYAQNNDQGPCTKACTAAYC
ncbi:MAG TPA: hypothetical protein VGB85_27460, partial [Nannocystis sp.]